jgi:hypothetical protein
LADAIEGAAFSPAAGGALPRRGLAMGVDVDMRFGVWMMVLNLKNTMDVKVASR